MGSCEVRMRLLFVLVGLLVILSGGVWALQGAGLIQGSFMSSDPTWIGIGTVTTVVGLTLVAFGFRGGSPAKKT